MDVALLRVRAYYVFFKKVGFVIQKEVNHEEYELQ